MYKLSKCHVKKSKKYNKERVQLFNVHKYNCSSKCQVILLKHRKIPLFNFILHLRDFAQHESYLVEVISQHKAQSPGMHIAIFCELGKNFIAEAILSTECRERHVYSKPSRWWKQAWICAIAGWGSGARGAGAGAGASRGAGRKRFAKLLPRDILKTGGPAESVDKVMAACSTFQHCTTRDMWVVWDESNSLLFGSWRSVTTPFGFIWQILR